MVIRSWHIHGPLALVIVCALIRPTPRTALSQSTEEHGESARLVATAVEGTPDALARLAEHHPELLLEVAQQRCAMYIDGYCCVMLRQERVNGKLGAVQRIALRYRAQPHSVYLHWLENAKQARRAVYVRGRDVSPEGEELAIVEPAGCVLRLFASRIRLAVHGELARESSRTTLDQVGYLGTFASLERVNSVAASRGELDLRYRGSSEVDQRPTYVLDRRLPYPGMVGYPNARLVLHLDQEWLLPVAIHTYADPQGEELLGSYTMTEVKVNPDLTDDAFEL